MRANRPRSSPGGELPTAQGLYYMDIWHISLPAHFGGERTVIGVTHAATGFNKTVGIKYKSQAADAMHVMLAFCNREVANRERADRTSERQPAGDPPAD